MTIDCATTIADCLRLSQQLKAVSDTPRLDVEVLLSDVLNQSRTFLYTWPERVLSAAEQAQFSASLKRRCEGEPIAYIIGKKEFWSLSLAVNPSTLIPRPETELLVEKALALCPADEAKLVVDLGTGTGAIAIALASECPKWQVLALDKAPAAVALAKANCAAQGLHNVTVIQSDWLAAIDSPLRFDMIASNPPYIDPIDPHLSEGDVRFEPASALIAQDSGFADIEAIVEQAIPRLNSGGWLLLEHGYQQAQQVRDRLLEAGLVEVFTERDLAGLDRISGGLKQ